MLDTSLVVLNLALSALDAAPTCPMTSTSAPSSGAAAAIETPSTPSLDEIRDDPDIQRLVIGVKRRTPVGKALLGSVSQRLLLEVDVPVLAVKI